MATFNVPGYVEVYKPTSYTLILTRQNEYKYFIFQDRAKLKSKKNVC